MSTDISFDYIQVDTGLDSPVFHAKIPAGSFSSWIGQLQSLAPSSDFALTYIDEEGDEIVIGSENELCLRIEEIQGEWNRANAFLWKRIKETSSETGEAPTAGESKNGQCNTPTPTSSNVFGEFLAGLGADLKDLERNIAQESKAAKRAIDDLFHQVSQAARNNTRNSNFCSILTTSITQLQTSLGVCGKQIEHTLSNSRRHYATILDHFAEVGHPVLQTAFETINAIRGVRDVDSDEEKSFHSVDEEKNGRMHLDMDELGSCEDSTQPVNKGVSETNSCKEPSPQISSCAIQLLGLGYFEPTDLEGAELAASIANYNIDTAITNIEQERERLERFS